MLYQEKSGNLGVHMYVEIETSEFLETGPVFALKIQSRFMRQNWNGSKRGFSAG
jgi:hypothetical protein